jgi:hypothetical protein
MQGLSARRGAAQLGQVEFAEITPSTTHNFAERYEKFPTISAESNACGGKIDQCSADWRRGSGKSHDRPW